jgi:hypothetical protein
MRRSSDAPAGAASHGSAPRPTAAATRLRTVRADGTPVYRYEPRPGTPPVSVLRFDPEHGGALGAQATSPGDHRHAHDFLVLVYVERGAGSVRVQGADLDLRDGDLHPIGAGQVLSVGSIDGLLRCRAWSAFFLPDAVPALAAVSPLAWAHEPLLAAFAVSRCRCRTVGAGLPGSPSSRPRSGRPNASVPARRRPRCSRACSSRWLVWPGPPRPA